MRALILAAGRGSRMKGLTSEQPKCMVRFRGRPLIEWQIQSLQEAGIDRVALVTGYQSERLLPYSEHIFTNAQWSQTNMVSSLLCAGAWLSLDSCIVSYSDIVYSADAVRRLQQANEPIAITYDPNWLQTWSRRFANPMDDAESFQLDPAGHLIDIGRKSVAPSEVQGQYMGLLKITAAGFATIRRFTAGMTSEQVAKLDMTSLLRGLLAQGERIGTVAIGDRWYEIDSQSDLELYESEAV